MALSAGVAVQRHVLHRAVIHWPSLEPPLIVEHDVLDHLSLKPQNLRRIAPIKQDLSD